VSAATDSAEPRTEEAERSVLAVVLHAPRPVKVLVAGVFLNRTGSFFTTFLVLFLRQLGFSLSQMPIILLAVGVAVPVGSMLGGWASDHFSRRTALVSSTILAAGGLAVIGLSPNRATALVGVFIAAMFAQAYVPAASALLVDHTEERDRVPTFAFFRLALNVGAALGPVLAVFIAPHGLKGLFLTSACCYTVFTAVLWFGLPKPSAAAVADGAEKQLQEKARAGHTPLGLLAFFGAALGITVVYQQYASSVSLAVSGTHGDGAYASLLTLNGVLVIVAEMPLSAWTRRLPWWIPLVLGAATIAVGIVMCGALHSYWLVAAGVVVWSAGEMLYFPVAASATAALSPPDRIGRYQGYLNTVQAVGFAMGPAIGIAVYGRSAGSLWAGCLVVGVLACAALAAAGRSASRSAARTAAAEA
jgi:predicted MFS family arabinose efflux permease